MELDPSIEPSVFIIVILVIVLIILYIFHLIKTKKQNNTNECKCNTNITQPVRSTSEAPKTENNDKKTQSNIIALYYGNGCIHSKMFLPLWDELKRKINSGELGSNINSKEYECSAEKNECEKNKIEGVPTIILHKINGDSINYPSDKPRNVESIKEFIVSQTK
jgi:Thioredoxin